MTARLVEAPLRAARQDFHPDHQRGARRQPSGPRHHEQAAPAPSSGSDPPEDRAARRGTTSGVRCSGVVEGSSGRLVVRIACSRAGHAERLHTAKDGPRDVPPYRRSRGRRHVRGEVACRCLRSPTGEAPVLHPTPRSVVRKLRPAPGRAPDLVDASSHVSPSDCTAAPQSGGVCDHPHMGRRLRAHARASGSVVRG